MTTISSGISSANSWGTAQPRTARHGEKPAFSGIDTGSANTTSTSSTGTSTALDDLFSKLDADGDGSISQSELDTGMKPPDHSQSGQNAYGSMGMDTQGFAAMMAGGMMGMGGMPPPPPPTDEAGSSSSTASSSSTSSTSSTDSANSTQQALLDLIDSDKSGDLSSKEVSAFADQMKALFEKMQQMGAHGGSHQAPSATSGTAASSLSVMA